MFKSERLADFNWVILTYSLISAIYVELNDFRSFYPSLARDRRIAVKLDLVFTANFVQWCIAGALLADVMNEIC